MLEYVFNKVAGMQLFCEYCQIFKNSIFHKIPSVAASAKFINFPGKHQWQMRNKFTFLINKFALVNILLTIVDISHFYINLSNI